jgi:hypothetical protein
MRYVFVLIGFLLIAGAVGNQDFYEECRAAADCVAGDPPSLISTVLMVLIGFALMAAGISVILAKEDR